MTSEELNALIQAKKQEKLAKMPRREFNLRITKEEGLYIQYRLKCSNKSCAEIAKELNCERQAVQRVTMGHTRSKRIESAIAQALGYETWNTMIHAMRSSAA